MGIDRDGFKDLLREKGLKITKQRQMVLEVLASSPDTHLTAEEIYDKVKTDCPEIGLATVYRTIQLLLELHLIDKINLDDGFVRYEFGDRGTSTSGHHHHHLICLRCGNVESFEDDLLEELEHKVQEKTGFRVVNHEVKFYGYCKKCGGNE